MYGKTRGRGQLKLDDHNAEIESSDDDSMINSSSSDSEEEAEDTVEDVKLRLAKEYLSKVEANVKIQKKKEDEDSDEEDEDGDDRVGYELQLARRERDGTLEQKLATNVQRYVSQQREQSSLVTQLRGHDLTPTCVALETSGEHAYSGSKDHSVFQWDVETQKRLRCIIPHYDKYNSSRKRADGEVLAMAVSGDGRYLTTGGRDKLVRVFDIRSAASSGRGSGAATASPVAVFKGHKSPVTSLTFRTQSLQLFSGSEDRCIRHYNLDEMAYVETLYGHQSAVMGMDCYRKERPVSIGRDRTMRAWKISEDSHLIFRGGSRASSADCISCVRDDWFVTGHEDGLVSLWLTDKKKPVKTIEAAHGLRRGISSCGTVKGSDLCATGSNDGFLRLWKVRYVEAKCITLYYSQLLLLVYFSVHFQAR